MRKESIEQIYNEVTQHGATLVAVTKYFGAEKIVEYYNQGLREFGENRVTDAVEKINLLSDEIKENSKFHLIGHLQTNKVKMAVGNFDLIHSVDSLKLAQAISKNAKEKNVVQNILVQVNNANEEQKFGILLQDLENIFSQILKLESLKIKGLMMMAPLGAEEKELKKLFENMRQIKDSLNEKFNCEMKELSMGMSNDYKIALEEGATLVRLGRILF